MKYLRLENTRPVDVVVAVITSNGGIIAHNIAKFVVLI